MGIKEFLEKRAEKSQRLKEVLEERKIQRLVEEREKSSDQRELERFIKEQEQRNIKAQLEIFRKKRQQEGNATTVLGGRNMFKDAPNIFAGHRSILTDNPALSLNTGMNRGMFFRW